MNIYGDVKSLSKTKKNKIERYYKMFKDLNMELSIIMTLDGWIYRIEYNGNTYDVEDDIIDDILDKNVNNKRTKFLILDIYMKVLSKEYTNLNDVYNFIEMNHSYYFPTDNLFNKQDGNITCKTYKEFIDYYHYSYHNNNKRMKTYATKLTMVNKKVDYNHTLCVYRFLDKDDNILYVGKTESMTNRMVQHFAGNGHLKNECYRQVEKIQYIQCENEADMNIKEIYFINKYKPKYNSKDLYEGKVHNVDYDSIKWDNEYPIPNKKQEKYCENN